MAKVLHRTGSRSPAWARIAVGALLVVVATVAGWHTARYALYGIHASGRVLQFHQPMPRSMDTVVQVEVSMPGAAPFRDQIEDNFSTGDWVEGTTTLSLNCIPVGAGHYDCGAGLGPTAMIPLLLFLAGGAMLLWGVKPWSR